MKKLILYFVLAYIISWLIWLPLFAPRFGITGLPVIPGYHHYIGSFGPMIAALIVNYFSGGSRGVKELLKRIIQWKVNWYWYAVVLAVPVLLVMAAGWADQFINDVSFTMKGFSTKPEFPQFGLLAYFLFNFFTFGIGEETGWRGYALPALQKRFSALSSTLILSIAWAGWHTPAFLYRPSYSQMDAAGIAGFFFSLLMGSIVLTWLYNSTRGSLLIVSLFHAMIELIFLSANITPAMSVYIGAAFMVAAVFIIFTAKPAHLSFLPKQTA